MTAGPVDGFQESQSCSSGRLLNQSTPLSMSAMVSSVSGQTFSGACSPVKVPAFTQLPLFLTDGFIEHSMLFCDHHHPLLLKDRVLYIRGEYANRFDPSDSTQQVIRARNRSQSRRGNRLTIRSLIGCCGAPNWRSGVCMLGLASALVPAWTA